MNHGPYFIPQGAPPGTPLLMEDERPPEAVYYFRIYGIVMILSLLGFFGMGLWMMLEPLMKGYGTVRPGEWIGGFIIAGIAVFFIVPHAIVLFAGRSKWVYTLAVVLIGMSMLWNTCCLPITIPLLIVWMKPETKKWYGIS
ncbi:MAG: hypothetical protein IPM54_32980 [Polyangiaceae bacterium]|nr:hypothetical protein [Polyangiaceae bacterium]